MAMPETPFANTQEAFERGLEQGRQEGKADHHEPSYLFGIQEERQRILQELATLKRWVATIQGVDEYVVRDKDLKKLV